MLALTLFVLIALALGVSTTADAQAWVDAPGRVSVGFFAEEYWGGDYLFNTDAYDGEEVRGRRFDGRRLDAGDVRAHTQRLRLDYAVRRNLGLVLDASLVASRYVGPGPLQLSIDDGEYHTNFQDGRVEVRYQLDLGPVSLTPLVGFSAPLSDYESHGHSAVGSGLREFQAGAYCGALGVPFRSGYAHLALVHRWPEESLGRHLQLTNARIETGVVLHRRLTVSGSLEQQLCAGGLEWLDSGDDGIHGTQRVVRTEVSNARFTRAAVATDLRLGHDLTMSGSWTSTIWGENTSDANYLSIGLSCRFWAPWSRPVWR